MKILPVNSIVNIIGFVCVFIFILTFVILKTFCHTHTLILNNIKNTKIARMEQLVLGIFQEQLAKVRKRQ